MNEEVELAMSICPFVCMCACRFFCLPVCLSICPFVCTYICRNANKSYKAILMDLRTNASYCCTL